MYTNVNTPQKLTTWNRVCDNIDLIKVPSATAEEIEHEIKIYIDKEGKLYYYDDKGDKQYIESIGQNPPTTDKDIDSEQNVGNIKPGDVIPGGSTITDIVDQIVGTKDWEGTYPKAYVLVTQVSNTQPTDDANNKDIYLFIDENIGTTTLQYNLYIKDGYFSLNDQKVQIPTYVHISPECSMPIDMSYPHTVNISGQYQLQEIAAKDYGCKNSKGEDSKCVLTSKVLDYKKTVHICGHLFYFVGATGINPSRYNKYIVYENKETSYDFSVNPGQTLYLQIPNGFQYSIIDQNGASITPVFENSIYKIAVASTGTKSTFTITLNPNSKENDN